MFQKKVLLSIPSIELKANCLERTFPGLEQSLSAVEIHLFHELFFKKFEKIHVVKKKKKGLSEQNFFIGQMVNDFICSRMLRSLDVWVLDSSNKQLLGKGLGISAFMVLGGCRDVLVT